MPAPTKNFENKNTYQFAMKVNDEPNIPTKHARIKALARPPASSLLPSPDPKIVPTAGIVFISDSFRCSDLPTQYLALKREVQTFI